MRKFQIISIFAFLFSAQSVTAFPESPKNSEHPGSQIYPFEAEQKDFVCSGRKVQTFIPKTADSNLSFPVVVYGHGQALDLPNYRASLEHLARKGIVAIFPIFDTGFFDQNWQRMAADYVSLSNCAIQNLKNLARADQVVFSGHSKGAYVASIAAGLAFQNQLAIQPKSILLFAAAGSDPSSLPSIDRSTHLTVVFSDQDTVVSRGESERIFNEASSAKKQFIFLRSYPSSSGLAIKADHFWPVTKGSVVGGGSVGPLHYYSAWKWLAAAAHDVAAGNQASNPFLYGEWAGDKGIDGLSDDVKRNW